MPVVNSGTPTVNVSVPVPTPVRQPKRPPVSFGGESDGVPPQQPTGPTGVPPQTPPRRRLSAVILPWSPPPKRSQPSQMQRKVVRYAAPISAVNPGETSHAALTRFLGNRNRRAHGRSAYVHRLPDGDIGVTLHGTQIVTAHRNGQVTMNHGGYMTPTTRRFVSGYSGVPVSFAGGRFTVRNPQTGNWEEYQNNTRYPPDEQSSFEEAIRNESTEATHHEVYADWLDEHQRPDEAQQHREHAIRLRNPAQMRRPPRRVRYAKMGRPLLAPPGFADHQEYVSRVVGLAKAGATAAEIAERVNRPEWAIKLLLRVSGRSGKKGRTEYPETTSPPDPRQAEIEERLGAGETLADTGAAVGVSKQRIHQLRGRLNLPVQSESSHLSRRRLVVRYSATPADLAGLLRAARENPDEPTGHAVIADALDEAYPGNKVADLIRRQYGFGAYGGQGGRETVGEFGPFYNSWDGTFPYHARLGRHGPFDLYLAHEGDPPSYNGDWYHTGWEHASNGMDEADYPGLPTGHDLQEFRRGMDEYHNGPPEDNRRWVVRAVSRLPGSRDSGYNFEFPHESAHEIPRLFPGTRAENFIRGDTGPGVVDRDREAEQFDSAMDHEERNRP